MKVLTKNTDYAIRSILYLARNKDSVVSVREISEKENIPFAYLRRILQQLVKKGVILSKEGIGGGLKLAYEPKKVSLIDIIRIFQGDIKLSECIFRKMACPNRAFCVVRKRIKMIEGKFIREIKSITIQSLLRDSKNKNKN